MSQKPHHFKYIPPPFIIGWYNRPYAVALPKDSLSTHCTLINRSPNLSCV